MTFKMWSTTSTAIKICGITTVDQGIVISKMGINAIGVIGVSASPRFLEETQRRILFAKIKEVAPEVKRVWVLANPNDSILSSGLNGTGIPSVVQLHGNESKKRCEELRKKYPNTEWWKAIRIKSKEDLLLANTYEGVIDKLLLDAWSQQKLGGSGERISQELLQQINLKVPWWIAGGISAKLVPEILCKIQPYGFDASSRLELSPGIKDLKKVADLIKAVKNNA